MPELPARERWGYALAMARGSMRGGQRTVVQYGNGPATIATVTAEPLWTRLRQAPIVARAAWRAAAED